MAATSSTVETMRRSTRLQLEIPVRIRSLDPARPFDLLTRTVIVNAHGCGLQSTAELPIGVPVELDVDARIVTGKVLNSALIDADREIYLTGVAFDTPGDIWNLESPPADWAAAVPVRPSAKVHPFAKRKSSHAEAAPAIHPFARPAPAAAGTIEKAGPRETSTPAQPPQAPLSTAHVPDWEQWRAQAASALSGLRDELQRKLSSDAEAWRRETQSAVATISELLQRAEQQGHLAGQHLKQIESVALSSKSEISAGMEALQRSLSLAQKSEAELQRFRGELQHLTDNAPALVESLVKQRAGQAMDAVAAEVQQKLSAVISAGLQQLQQQIEAMSGAAASEVRSRLVADFDARQAALLEIATNRGSETDRREIELRSTSEQLAAELTRRAAQAADDIRRQMEHASAASLEKAAAAFQGQLAAMLQRMDADLELRKAAVVAATADISRLTDAGRSALREEAERSTAAAKQSIGEIATSTASQIRDRLVAELGVRQTALLESSDELSAKFSRQSEEAMANLRMQVEQASATSVAKLSATLEASEEKLAQHVQQQAWEYDAQAEAAAGRLQEKLAAALQRLESDIDQRQAAVVGGIAAGAHKITEESRSALQAESDHQAQSFRQQVEAEVRQRKEEFVARNKELEAGFAALQAERQLVTNGIAELQQTKGYIESLLATLPETLRAHAQQHATEAWEQLRDRSHQQITDAVRTEADLSAARLRDEIAASAKQLREQMAAQAQQTADQLQSRISDLLTQRHQQLAAELDAHAANHEFRVTEAAKVAGETVLATAARAETSVRQGELRVREAAERAATEFAVQAKQQAEAHRQQADSVHQDALRRLKEVEQSSAQLLGESEAALMKSAAEVVNDEIARAQHAARERAASESEAALAAFRERSARVAADHVVAAEAASKRAAAAAADLQVLHDDAQAKSQEMRKQIEEAQRWLQQQSTEFQKTVHDAFLSAGGEIRGRVSSAVDTAEELMRQKAKDAVSQMETAANQQVQVVARSADEAQARISAAQASAAEATETVLQAKLVEMLDSFRTDASRLAESALSRWQTAMDETLRAIPGMLKTNFELRAEAKPATTKD